MKSLGYILYTMFNDMLFNGAMVLDGIAHDSMMLNVDLIYVMEVCFIFPHSTRHNHSSKYLSGD